MFFRTLFISTIFVFLATPVFCQTSTILEGLASAPDFETHRISSYDRTGGNNDRLNIKPGETKVLAEIEGPGAITHIWNTIDGENYYSRMLILRFYWDGQEIPSIEVPLGDFFGVGHGLQRAFHSLPVAVSSDGRARNCYWYMPFQKSAKVTITHEGFETLRAFYYYIDYRKYKTLPPDQLYFHAQYRQATPNPKVELGGKNVNGQSNYLLMETKGQGLYVGTVLSAQINRNGWFGEGDDMFFVDGVETPTMTGTGTEDYFNDAWGFREFDYPYHGVTLWEGYDKGARVTAYKWHIHDPIAFTKSLRASIEHGHANDREDDWYSVAYWYQTLPSPKPPALANVMDRLPDEGRLFASRVFANQGIALDLQNERYEDALNRIEECVKADERADEYGFWSMRKGFLFKQMGKLDEAKAAFASAIEKSETEDQKSNECDAPYILWAAKEELPILEKKRSARIYASSDDPYEIFLDGKSIGEGRGGQRVDDFLIEKLGKGTHLLAIKCTNKSGRAGLSILISHRGGLDSADASWKVTSKEEEQWNERKFDDSKWSDAEEIGILGQAPWRTERLDRFYFMAPVLSTKVIWSPDGAKSEQTVYFRKSFRVR